MPTRHIASRENPHYKALKKLAGSARERRKCGLTLLDGVHLAKAWGETGRPVEEYLVSETAAGQGEIADYLATCQQASITLLTDKLFADLSPVDTPTGLLTCVQARPPTGLPAENEDTVVLDGVQDPGNVGSILRSAAAAGFKQAVLSADCAHPWSPKSLRAGMGAQFVLRIYEGVVLESFLADFRGTTAATLLDGEKDLYSAAVFPPVAWVFGHEGEGIRPPVAAATRLRVRIPMPGPMESLNVAAAAALCLFETVRRRNGSPDR